MKKTSFLSLLVLLAICFVAQGQVFVKFQVEQLSVNVAEGTTELVPKFVIRKDTTGLNDTSFVEVKHLQFNDLDEIGIEKMQLEDLGQAPDFQSLDSYILSSSEFERSRLIDADIEKGAIYIYKLTSTDTKGVNSTLAYSVARVNAGNPLINCAKYNNVYRFSCHNCFQESVISPLDGGLYHALDFTRVIELDIHIPPAIIREQIPGVWDVRHTGSGNKNNCGVGTFGDNALPTCLNDIRIWHNYNPGHDPITLFIDLKSDFNSSSHTPSHLDNQLSQMFGLGEIYKPNDFLGSHNNMRENALWNNWPTMGDLQNKFIFVLTGNEDRLQHYLNNRGNNAIAFVAANVKEWTDPTNLPNISASNKSKILFHNINLDHINSNAGITVSNNIKGVSRVWDSNVFGVPLGFSNSEYTQVINKKINHIAVKDIDDDYNPDDGFEINGIQSQSDITNPILSNYKIRSSYNSITDFGIGNISVTDLEVFSGAHYRLTGTNRISLNNHVSIKLGSSVKIGTNSSCYTGSSYLRKLSQPKIENNEIKNYIQKIAAVDSEKLFNEITCYLYPNPTQGLLNIFLGKTQAETIQISIVDTKGLMQFSKYYENFDSPQIEIDITHLPVGVYLLKVENGQVSVTKKIIKI